MQTSVDIKVDEFFAMWLVEPCNRCILDEISRAARLLDGGETGSFDFAVFDTATKVTTGAQRHKPPTLSSSSMARIQIDKSQRAQSFPTQPKLPEAVGEKIPTFYGNTESTTELAAVEAASKKLTTEVLADLLSTHCQLPKCFAPLLMKGHDFSGDHLVKWWRENMLGKDPNSRFFTMIVGNDRDFIFPSDLTPFVRALVESHPSLEFLQSEELFQEKFIDFIVTRCFYIMDSELRGTAGLHQFRKMNIAGVFFNAEKMGDVNDSHHIFNYQHFYVAFCKFWDLDGDSDGLISKDDLMKFNDSAISPIIIERFFQSSFFPRSSNRKQTLDFTAFAYFLMSSEDKTNPTSINFWYKLCDLDDDGVLSLKEIEELYEIQFERMRITGNETIPFEDIIRQLKDMINPADPSIVTVSDLVNCKLADVFYNTLFDLQKFLVREYQFTVNPDLDDVTKHLSPCELYVLIEYDQLVNDGS